jgi:hypothetical protein
MPGAEQLIGGNNAGQSATGYHDLGIHGGYRLQRLGSRED